MSRIDTSYRYVLRLTAPVLVTQLSYTAMGVIDTMMVGRLGVLELGAVGFANLLTWWFLSFFHGILIGVNTFVAQAHGAGDDRKAGIFLWHGLYLAIGAAGLIALVSPLAPTVFGWTGASDEMQRLAVHYAQVRLLGGLALTLLVVGDNFYRGLGRTDVPMWCALGQVVVNCGLNYLLIYGKLGLPALGVTGAALGTVISQSLVALTLLGSAFGRREWRQRYHLLSTWRPDLDQLRVMLRVSLPIGVQVFMEMGGISVFTALVARLGDVQMAATNAVIQAWSLGYMSAFALAAGATTLVGHCLGARQPGEARRAVGKVMVLGLILTTVIGVLYVVFPVELIGLFVAGADVDALEPYARPLFLVVTVCLYFDLRLNVVAGALRGAGDTRYTMLVNVASAWLVFVPATLFASQRWGVVGAFWCFAIHVALMTLLLELRYRGDSWMGRVIDSGNDDRGGGSGASDEEASAGLAEVATEAR